MTDKWSRQAALSSWVTSHCTASFKRFCYWPGGRFGPSLLL